MGIEWTDDRAQRLAGLHRARAKIGADRTRRATEHERTAVATAERLRAADEPIVVRALLALDDLALRRIYRSLEP